MSTTWILVAHDAGARLYGNAGAGKGLDSVLEIDHPEGRLKDQDINADKPGKQKGVDGSHHGVDTGGESPTEHAHALWAQHLADMLGKGLGSGKCAAIVLVAPPRLLGLIRKALNGETAKAITATLDKDLAHAKDAEVADQLKDVIRL